ncbi:MAG: alpha/beta fold hydrolase [Pseudomonadota bacterium]
MNDGIIILHGIFRTERCMSGLAKFLQKSGFKVLNLGYPSTKYSLEELADIIHKDIESFAVNVTGKLHFVGYSMGGLLIRAYLKKYRPSNLGRVVLIGTPNYGSEVADFVKNWALYKKLYGPAGQQLITDQSDFKHIFADTDFEVGIVAGNRPLDFISSRIIKAESDGKVSLKSATLEGAKDRVIIPCSHTFFPQNKKMWLQVVHFIGYGKFPK